MKISVIAMLFMMLSGFVFSQGKVSLTGTWYGKVRAYPFSQFNSAKVFTANKIANWQELLMIDKNYNYTFASISKTDTITESGKVKLSGDTLMFIQDKSNSDEFYKPVNYFLYDLRANSIIYSYSQIPGPQPVEESIFTKVEEAAVGDYQFFKAIYQSLVKTQPQSIDSVFLNEYEVAVKRDRAIDISSFEEKNAYHEYAEAIKNGLLLSASSITPAKQNGRYVNGYFRFAITY